MNCLRLAQRRLHCPVIATKKVPVPSEWSIGDHRPAALQLIILYLPTRKRRTGLTMKNQLRSAISAGASPRLRVGLECLLPSLAHDMHPFLGSFMEPPA